MANVVFMGTPDFAVPALKALIDHHNVVAVVTQPDRPAERGGKIRMSPIKEVALTHDLPVLQPERLRRKDAIAELREYACDVYVVAAFGQILPQSVLDIPEHGSINIHASLLPRWRGAAPIHAAIRAGDAETGVTIMKMDAGLDTGPILQMRSMPIANDDTGQSLHDRLSDLGAELLIETLPAYLTGDLLPRPQPDEGVTYAPQITKDEGEIDWTMDALHIERLVRAFTPWPGTYTTFRGKTLKIHSGTIGDGDLPTGKVGTIDQQIAIGTSNGVFFPTEVQLAGKKRTDITSFVNGYPDFVGNMLPDPS